MTEGHFPSLSDLRELSILGAYLDPKDSQPESAGGSWGGWEHLRHPSCSLICSDLPQFATVAHSQSFPLGSLLWRAQVNISLPFSSQFAEFRVSLTTCKPWDTFHPWFPTGKPCTSGTGPCCGDTAAPTCPLHTRHPMWSKLNTSEETPRMLGPRCQLPSHSSKQRQPSPGTCDHRRELIAGSRTEHQAFLALQSHISETRPLHEIPLSMLLWAFLINSVQWPAGFWSGWVLLVSAVSCVLLVTFHQKLVSVLRHLRIFFQDFFHNSHLTVRKMCFPLPQTLL